MARRRRGYVTVGTPPAPQGPSGADEAHAQVAYEPSHAAAEATRAGGLVPEEDKPVILVACRGRAARRLLRVVREAGFRACAAYAQDRSGEGYLKAADLTVCLGQTATAALFSNSHAMLQAARACGAQAILLCEESLPLAQVDNFLARAAARGVLVFKVAAPDAPALGWVECVTDKPPLDDDEWVACPGCGLAFDARAVAARHHSCPSCGALMRMTSSERVEQLLDADSFEEWDAQMPEADPLGFPGYPDKLRATREASGLSEAVRTGRGTVAGLPLAIGLMDSTFLMGSMGSVAGEKLRRLFDRATAERLPVVVLTASGGARMQEGLASLMQMAKVSCAVQRHAQAGLVYVSVITDPTTGGVTASFATQGDVVLAEPGALLGFAGKRVIRDTIRQELPEGFQSAEFALEHGLVDAVVPRDGLRAALAHVLAVHQATARPGEDGMVVSLAQVDENLRRGTAARNTVTYGAWSKPALSGERASWRARLGRTLRAVARRAGLTDGLPDQGPGDAPSRDALAASPDGRAWESVRLARDVHRPTARFYIDALVDGFIELHGDRAFGDDAAIVAGLGWIDGHPVTVIAQEKGTDVKERIRRNFGCPLPEGYRKSLRLMRQAEKFGRPVVCLVDTQGAFCGTEAEERGQGNAIAENLLALAGLRVPVVSVLLGEGGSGGALALALADRVAMQEHAVYSVLSPEGFASILWKDRARAPEAAALMRMSAEEALGLGVVDAVLPEGPGPAHENPADAACAVRAYVSAALEELARVPVEELLAARHERFSRL